MSCPRIIPVILAAAGALLLGGCLPIPHRDTLSPPMEGAVRFNGQPVAGAQVYVGGWECDFNGEPQARTDANGAFRIPRRDEISYFLAMDRFFAWRLCIVRDGKRYLGLFQRDFTYPYRKVRLDCDLATPQQEGAAEAQQPAPGVCRAEEGQPAEQVN